MYPIVLGIYIVGLICHIYLRLHVPCWMKCLSEGQRDPQGTSYGKTKGAPPTIVTICAMNACTLINVGHNIPSGARKLSCKTHIIVGELQLGGLG